MEDCKKEEEEKKKRRQFNYHWGNDVPLPYFVSPWSGSVNTGRPSQKGKEDNWNGGAESQGDQLVY